LLETDNRMPPLDPAACAPGRRLARGVCRALVELNFAALEEVVPEPGLRVDVMALGPAGEVWVVECKSSLADFRADRKWRAYLPWCDRFFWAVPAEFPADCLPEEGGLMLADDYGAEIVRQATETRLAPARRRALTLRLARLASFRHLQQRDPRT
jgi:hypothetical protein